MNQQNVDYLKDNVKYLGFGEELHPTLEAKVKEGKEAFSLQYKAHINEKPFEATLNFRKSDNSDMYFLNNYQASLQLGDNDTARQTFYLNKGKGVTCKEAFNLLEGRAVNKDLTSKEGQIYNAWMQLDFKETDAKGNYHVNQYHHNYGYNLQKELQKHPIKELESQQGTERLIESMQKGNRQSVTFMRDGKEEKMFIEANPRFKTVNVYDTRMQRVNNQAQRESKGQQQTGTKQHNDEKLEVAEGDEGIPGKNTRSKRNRRQGIS